MAEQSSAPVLESLSHLEPLFPASTSTKALIALAIIVVIAASSAHFKNVHEREPPVLRSWIPFIGHLIGMIRQQSNYLPSLAKYGRPIASLPILNGKVYAIWDGSLIQAVYRNKDLSFVPFVIEFAQRELGYGVEHDKIVKESGLMDEFFDEIHKGMAPHYVHRMNANALQDVANTLKSIGDNTQEIPNVWLWIRDLMTLATCKGLYGPENPIGPNLLDLVWDFERDLAQLMFFPLPQYSASKSYNARAKLQAVLNDYYARKGDHHEDAAGITRHRADVLRKFGVQSAEVGIFEVALLHVATSNTIPTLFWFMMHIVSRPELVDRLREEVSHVAVSNGSNIRTVNVQTLTNECPLLVSCYREAIRICNRAEGQRKVMKETTISDGKGRSYLLKEGTNVQMPAESVHSLQQVWGEDATEFNPDRFLEQVKGLNNENVKAQRTSYIPFGGGRHLCPGRNFAMAENLGFLVAFLLGFEVSSMDGKPFVLPIMEQRSMTSAVCKPLGEGEGFGMRVKRREGWEQVDWQFTSGASSRSI